jgi:hypothetical protein
MKKWQNDTEKLEVTLLLAMKTQTGGRRTALPTHNIGATTEWVASATPWPLYPLKRMLVGHRDRCGRGRKRSPPPPPEFEPRTFQPVTSSCTDCTIPAAGKLIYRT